MAKGPLGGPRPFAQYDCSVVMVLYVDYDDYYGTETAHQVEDTVAEVVGYVMDEDRRDVKSYGLEYGAVVTVPFQQMLGSSFNSMHTELKGRLMSLKFVSDVEVNLDAGDAQQILEERV